MWLVLCHAEDASAIWAYHGLRARGLAPLELVTAESLAFALRWEHRVGINGAWFQVKLADGREIDSREVRGALNRIQYVPMPHWRSASEKDRDYVQQELFAFFNSCLFCLPGAVLNPATAQGLSGASKFPDEWARAAALAGLPAEPRRRNAVSIDAEGTEIDRAPRASAFVAGAAVVGAPPGLREPCLRLAGLSGAPLLGIDFTFRHERGWQFASATNSPNLGAGGPPLLDALSEALRDSRPGSAQ